MKNPGLAAIMSFFVMGLGHIYVGRVATGIFVMVGAFIGTLVAFQLWPAIPLFYLLIFLLIYWATQVFDAHRQATEYNRLLVETGEAPW